MVEPSSQPSRSSRAGRWLAPSAVAACAGTLVAALAEGVEGAGQLAAAAGFLGMLAIPALFAASLVVRGLIAAWRPRELAARLVDGGGGAPRLAGWIGVLWVGALVLAWAVYRGTWWLASLTAFKPMAIGFATPVITVGVALLLLALSRPGARLFAHLAARVDARWRRAGRSTLLRPRTILVSTVVVSVLLVLAVWRFEVRPRLGPFDTSVIHAPAAGLVAALLVHAVWSHLRHRLVAGALIAGLGLAAVGFAGLAVLTRPSLTLEIWGDRPLTGLAIDRLFDLERIRSNIDLAEFRPVDRPGSPHPDILLITIDTVRADYTPPYGGSTQMPTLRGLGERGTVFEWAFAPSNVTRRSIPSMVIGTAPNRIRGRVVGWALRVDPRHVLLAERLLAGGYDTAGFMCCHGFWSPEVRTGLQRGLEHLEIEKDGTKLARAARRWIEAREARGDREPLFVWMHLIEPHNYLEGIGEPRTDDERKRHYIRSLVESDTMLADVLRPFRDRAPEQAPIVIVTADHAEALGEHGAKSHSTDLYNSQIHVPLVIAGPGIRAQRIPETVSLTDLAPTVLALAGFVPPAGPGADGRSLADLATAARAPVADGGTAFAAMIKDRSNPGGVVAIVRGRWKLIESEGTLELYDVRADPGELTNVVGEHPRIVAELRTLLEAKKAAGAVSPFD